MPKLYACIISPDIERDRDLLIGAADRFASAIEVIEDGVLFDVSGLERLIGKPGRIAQKIVKELSRKNVKGKVAVADTVDTARLLARSENPHVSEDDSDALSDPPSLTVGLVQPDMFDQIPIAELDLEADTLNVFNELGFHTVKDLAKVPHDELIGRYGQQFNHVIDVIEQRGKSLITPNVKENKVSWNFELNNPVEDFEQLIFLLNHGLERLFAEVRYAGYSTEHLDLGLTLRNKTTRSYEIKTSFPTLDRPFWLKLINLRAALDPPEEPITTVDVIAYFTKPRTDQRGLYAVSRPEPESLLLTVNKLKKLVGPENVGVPQLLNDRLTEPFKLAPDTMPDVAGEVTKRSKHPSRPRRSIYDEPGLAETMEKAFAVTPPLSLVAESDGIAAKPFLPRPVIVFTFFRPPIHAEVLIRDDRLVYIRSRLFAGYITNFSGVWKGNSHWWGRRWKTHEWDIEIEAGGIYRLCKAKGEWFLVGEYD